MVGFAALSPPYDPGQPHNTSWVCVTSATSLSSSVVTRVCHTIVRRPRCSGVAAPVIRLPRGAAAMKLVLLSIVVVPAPPLYQSRGG